MLATEHFRSATGRGQQLPKAMRSKVFRVKWAGGLYRLGSFWKAGNVRSYWSYIGGDSYSCDAWSWDAFDRHGIDIKLPMIELEQVWGIRRDTTSERERKGGEFLPRAVHSLIQNPYLGEAKDTTVETEARSGGRIGQCWVKKSLILLLIHISNECLGIRYKVLS